MTVSTLKLLNSDLPLTGDDWFTRLLFAGPISMTVATLKLLKSDLLLTGDD